MAQWLGIHLLMQGNWVQFLVGKSNPTCLGATEPVRPNQREVRPPQ